MEELPTNTCIVGEARAVLETLPASSVDCCVTSPPYWGLRDYGVAGQLGLEPTPAAYVESLLSVLREVHRVLKDDGTLWLNLGDSYAGSWGAQSRGDASPDVTHGASHISAGSQIAHMPRGRAGTGSNHRTPGLKPKDMVGIPWRVAFALREDGWWLRSEIIWHKPNPMPESVEDRPTKAHEKVFLLSKRETYFYNARAIAEPLTQPRSATAEDAARAFTRRRNTAPRSPQPDAHLSRPTPETRNARDVWTVPSEPYRGAHFACFPKALAARCILAGCPMGGVVLDPFFGSGTTGQVAASLGRRWLGVELNPKDERLWRERTSQLGLPFGEVSP